MLGSLGRIAASLYREDRGLFWTALAGIGLGGVCFLAMAVEGPLVEPEGQLFKAASFDIAVGIFLLTLGLIVPSAGFSQRRRKLWRRSLIALVSYGYAVETSQIFRGLDPRFSRVGSNLDGMIGGFFFLSALGIFVLFLILAARFFFRSTAAEGGALVLALRYGAVAAVLAFGVGIAMSLHGGPRVGPSGNLLPLHAAGFHGLQAVPPVALLMAWSRASGEASRRAVHLTGLAWLAACAAIAWQSVSGRSVLELSAATAAAAAALAVWGALLLRAALAFRRGGSWPQGLTDSSRVT
jgi:hypothetical protein